MTIKPNFNIKNKNQKDITGLKLSGEYPDSRVEFKETLRKDAAGSDDFVNLDKTTQLLNNYKVLIPIEVDQREFFDKKDTVKVKIINTTTKKNKGVISKNFSINIVNKILKTDLKEIKSQKNKKFLQKLKDQIKKIESNNTNTNSNSLNQKKYNLLFSKYYDSFESFNELINEINQDTTTDTQLLPISDIVDYKSNKNNIGKKSNLTDEQLFGSESSYVIAKSGRNNNPDTQDQFLPYKLNDEYTSKSNDYSIKESGGSKINDLYDLGRDPAEMFNGNETHVGLQGSTLGNVPESSGNVKLNDSDQNIQKSLINDIVSQTNFSSTDRDSLAKKQKRENEYVTKSKKVSKRFKKSNIEVSISKNNIDAEGNVTLKLLRSNEKGLTTQKKYRKINVLHHLTRHILSNFSIENMSINVQNIGYNKIYLTIKNFHNFDIIYYTSYKTQKNNNNYTNNKFEDLESGVIDANNEVSIVIDNVSLDNTIFRSSYGIKIPGFDKELMTDNIYSTSFVSRNLTKTHKECYTYIINNTDDETMEVGLYNLPGDSFRYQFYRRNVTNSNNSLYEKLIDKDTLLPLEISTKSFVIDNYQLLENNVYEYYAEIENIYGNKYQSKPFREYFFKSENFVKINIKSSQRNTQLGGAGSQSYLVDIEKIDNRKNTVRELIDIVKELGDESFFDDDIKAINQASQELLSVEVEQTEYKGNCLYYKSLGIFRSGEEFNIIIKSNNNFNNNLPNYIKITPYQNSPLLIVNLVNDLISKIDDVTSNTSSNSVEKSVLLSKVKKKVENFKINRDKYFSKDYLKNGRLPPDVSPDLNNGLNDIVKSNPIDDIFYKEISNQVPTPFSDIVIRRATFYRFTNNKKILVSFDLDIKNDQKMIDFYVLMAKKNKEYFPVTSFNAKGNGNYNIIDDTNKNYMGRLEYYLVPVDIFGKTLSRYLIKKINLYDYRKI